MNVDTGNCSLMPSRWIAFDCETTGLLPRARLMEIAAVVFSTEGAIIDEFHRFAKPPGQIPTLITRLTGITADMLRDAPSAADALREFFRWLPLDTTLIAHNVAFDLAVIAREAPGELHQSSHRFADSLALARGLGEFPDHRLPTIAGILDDRSHRRSHRALDDAHTVRRLVLHALSRNLHHQRPELFTGVPPDQYL